MGLFDQGIEIGLGRHDQPRLLAHMVGEVERSIAERIGAGRRILLDVTALFQRVEQPEHQALCVAGPLGEVGNADIGMFRQHLQQRKGPIDRRDRIGHTVIPVPKALARPGGIGGHRPAVNRRAGPPIPGQRALRNPGRVSYANTTLKHSFIK